MEIEVSTRKIVSISKEKPNNDTTHDWILNLISQTYRIYALQFEYLHDMIDLVIYFGSIQVNLVWLD